MRKKKKGWVLVKKVKLKWKVFIHKICVVYNYDRKVYLILGSILIICLILLWVL